MTSLKGRANVYIIHSWENGDEYATSTIDGLRREDPACAHYTVTQGDAIDGTEAVVRDCLSQRIKTATTVVVINTEGLHRRRTAAFEMETATRMGKTIVVAQPEGFDRPIPSVLDGRVYRFVGRRIDVLARAIRGEYPADSRTYRLAEVVELQSMAQLAAFALGAISFLVVGDVARSWAQMKVEFAAQGIDLRWEHDDTQAVVRGAMFGAAAGAALALLFLGDSKSALTVGLAGAALGAAFTARRVCRVKLLNTSQKQWLVLEPT